MFRHRTKTARLGDFESPLVPRASTPPLHEAVPRCAPLLGLDGATILI